MTFLKPCLSDLRDQLRPRRCPLCGARLADSEAKVCATCLLLLPYLHVPDFYDNAASRLFWGRLPVERTCCFIGYGHDAASYQLLMRLKYAHRPDVGLWLGRQMAIQLQPLGFFDSVEAIVPVPLHWMRWLGRGYNQSSHLAQGVAEVVGLPVWGDAVRRIRNNPSQTSKTGTERLRNVDNVFRLRRGVACGHVLLVDDVLTTGATLTSLGGCLLRANPAMRFSILTLAKASS